VCPSTLPQTGYEKYLLDGGLTTSASKQGDEAERVDRIWQLLGAAADYSPGAMSGAVSLDEDYPEGGGSGSTDNVGGSPDSDTDRESRLALRVTLIGTDDGDVEFSIGDSSEYSDFSDGDFGGTEEAETERAGGEGGAAGAGGTGAEAEEGGGGRGADTLPSMPPLQRAQNFLDEVALYSGADEGGAATPGVRLMTMHAAKGLEFELVYMPGGRVGGCGVDRCGAMSCLKGSSKRPGPLLVTAAIAWLCFAG
jgi:hypothetical protein